VRFSNSGKILEIDESDLPEKWRIFIVNHGDVRPNFFKKLIKPTKKSLAKTKK
jgi:hypothetical protein